MLLNFWIVVMKRKLMTMNPRFFSFIPLFKITSGTIFNMAIVILIPTPWKISRIFEGQFDANPPKKIDCHDNKIQTFGLLL